MEPEATLQPNAKGPYSANATKAKVSVIVPVYNPGSGIDRCIESLLNQTLAEIEIIFVDDCGTDGSMDTVRAAVKSDARITVIQNERNLGPGISRNKGIDAARGTYLCFIDADDYIEADFLELLYNKACSERLDICKGTITMELEDGTPLPASSLNRRLAIGLKHKIPLYILFSGEHQSAIFCRTAIERLGVRYGSHRQSEDITFLLRVGTTPMSFGLQNRAVYHWVQRRESTSHEIGAVFLQEKAAGFTEQVDFLENRFGGDEFAALYAQRRIHYYLAIHKQAEAIPEIEKAACKYLCRIRTQVLRLPFIERLKRRDAIVQALCDEGRNVLPIPQTTPWNRSFIQKCAAFARTGLDSMKMGPSSLEAKAYRQAIWRSLKERTIVRVIGDASETRWIRG